MTKEKLASLKVYVSKLKDRLAAPVPSKHAGHPKSYHQFLRNEIATVESALEVARLESTGK